MATLIPNVVAALQQLEAAFAQDELAYLALTQKVEHAIRDKLAYRLYKLLENDSREHLVCREWNRCDLAVLEAGVPRLLLEAKAMYSFDIIKAEPRHPYHTNVMDDLAKAARLAKKAKSEASTEMAALVIATHPHAAPKRSFKHAVKYFGGVCKHAVESNNFKAAEAAFKERVPLLDLVHSQVLAAGSAFGTDVSVFCWLFAPSKTQRPLSKDSRPSGL